MNQKALRFVILCLLAASLVLSACGRGGSDDAAPTEAPTEAPEPTAEPTQEAEPTATEEPTAEPTEAPESTATPEAEEEAEVESAEGPDSPLPAPESPLTAPESPLAAGASPLTAPDDVPAPPAEPSDTAGSVIGAIIVLPAGDGEPYRPVADAKVSLAGVLEREGDNVQVAGYEPATAPFGQSDEYGRFAINDVPPGKWAVILDMVMQQHLLEDPETGNGIVIEVVEGEVIDLGTLTYDSLPLVGYE